jgi:hypothetical protein
VTPEQLDEIMAALVGQTEAGNTKGVFVLPVFHDDWCARFKGESCDCDAEYGKVEHIPPEDSNA